MACYHPLQAYQCADGSVVFAERRGADIVRSLVLPCGQCVGCRLERSRQWAIRVMHEASLYDQNCFITLTYDDEHCPSGLTYQDFQLFMKRLRRRFFSSKIRFYMCGEYGENFGRPHFHACLFNFDFPDKLYFKKAGDSKVYTSRILGEVWPFGFTLIGAVTFESAAYVARYCMAKVTGEMAEGWYTVVDAASGEITFREPEFNRMSLKPGIGQPWFQRFASDVYPRGECVVRGRYCRPPRYYDKLFERADADGMEYIKYKRYLHGLEVSYDNTDERVAVKEQVAIARATRFVRSL